MKLNIESESEIPCRLEGAEKANYDRIMEERAAELQQRFMQQESSGGGAAVADETSEGGASGGLDAKRFDVDSMAKRASISFANQKEMLENIREQRKARRAKKLHSDN